MEVGSQGKIETTPIVWNGTLYGTSTWSVVYAVDARTGVLKWRWDPALVKGGYGEGGPRYLLRAGQPRRGHLQGPRLRRAARRPAGRARRRHRTGGVVGADHAGRQRLQHHRRAAHREGQGRSSATAAASTACAASSPPTTPRPASRRGAGSSSLAIRPRASKIGRWRSPLKTWKGEWWKYGGGGTPWDGIAYDPEANLVYVGTGNGSPWSRDHRSQGSGDNLYLSSIVALNADTGRYVWHYQTTPGDDWDYNAAQPMILADLTIDGQPRKVLLQAPKNGFFYVIDRLTGELLSAQPYVAVNWATHIDLKTGRPVETPEARYGAKGSRLSPSAVGAHHWPPMAFNPATGLVYFPGQETSMVYRTAEKFDFQEGQWNTGTTLGGAAGAAAAGATAAPPRRKAFFVAWDPVANKERWRIDFTSRAAARSPLPAS